MQLAIVGRNSGWALRARSAGLDVVGFAAEAGDRAAFAADGVRCVAAWTDFFELLAPPRIYLLDLPLGETVERVLEEGSTVMEPGDVVVDPGGSWWCDTLRRWRRLRHRALYFVDAAELRTGNNGLLLVAGDMRGVELARPVLERLVLPASVRRAGSAGAAHYLAMLADAVATARAQAHSEAVQLVEAWPGDLDCALAREIWPVTEAGLSREAWVPDDAVRLEAAVPLLAQAVMLRMAERLDEHLSEPPPPRLGVFVTSDEIE